MKQQKLFDLLGKRGKAVIPEDCVELQAEIQDLEQKLLEKQNELFQLQRNSYRCKPVLPKSKPAEMLSGPLNIVLNNAIETLKNDINLVTMLTGMEVQSYVANDHCCIMYHMQHDLPHEVKHGLRIKMKNGVNKISKSSFPIGFNINAVLEDFDNVKSPQCLGAIRKALVAYYDRLEQYDALKRLLHLEAQMFKLLDGSHIQIMFDIVSNDDDDDKLPLVLTLDYRVYDVRPKTCTFREIDLPDSVLKDLQSQCVVFKKKPLHKAFKEAFMNSSATYRLLEKMSFHEAEMPECKRQRFRANRHNKYNDDTFLPEDCSVQSDEETDSTEP